MSANQTKLLSMLMQMGMEKSGLKDKNGKSKAKALPALLVGDPGIAKTDIVQHIGRSLQKALNVKFPVEIYACPQLNAEDLAGLPVPDRETKTTELYPLRIGKSLMEAKAGVAFLDEYSSAQPAVGAAALTFIQNGRIGETQLSEAVARVLAMNPAEIAAAGRELTAPESNRVCWIDWDLEPVDWIDYMRGGAGAAKDIVVLPNDWELNFFGKASALVTGFIGKMPGSLLVVPDAANASQAWRSPRSWENCTRILAACYSLGYDTGTNLTVNAIQGCIGSTGATEFLTWVTEMDLPDPEFLLANPDTELPTRADRLMVTMDSVVLAATAERPDRATRVQAAAHIIETVFAKNSGVALPALQMLMIRCPDRNEKPKFNTNAVLDALKRVGLGF